MHKTIRNLLIAATATAMLGAIPVMASSLHKDKNDSTQHHQRQAERMAERQQQLKTALNITAEQEAAWNTYTEALKRPEAPPKDNKALADMTTPERLDAMQTRKAERDAHQTRVADATRSLYAALSPEQQKVFDQQSMKRHRGKMMGERQKSHNNNKTQHDQSSHDQKSDDSQH